MLPEGQGALAHVPGGGQLALIPKQSEQVPDTGGRQGVVGLQHLLPDGQGALEKGPGGGQLAQGLKPVGQIAERRGGVGVVGPRPVPDGLGALEEGPGNCYGTDRRVPAVPPCRTGDQELLDEGIVQQYNVIYETIRLEELEHGTPILTIAGRSCQQDGYVHTTAP